MKGNGKSFVRKIFNLSSNQRYDMSIYIFICIAMYYSRRGVILGEVWLTVGDEMLVGSG